MKNYGKKSTIRKSNYKSEEAPSIDVDDASDFPDVSAGADYCYATIDSGSAIEIVKVTSISSNTLTVVRGEDDTTGLIFGTGSAVEIRITAALLTDVLGEVADNSISAVKLQTDAVTAIKITLSALNP